MTSSPKAKAVRFDARYPPARRYPTLALRRSTTASDLRTIDSIVEAIQQLELMEGDLPRCARELVLDWAKLHQADLLVNWGLCERHLPPHAIAPLQ